MRTQVDLFINNIYGLFFFFWATISLWWRLLLLATISLILICIAKKMYKIIDKEKNPTPLISLEETHNSLETQRCEFVASFLSCKTEFCFMQIISLQTWEIIVTLERFLLLLCGSYTSIKKFCLNVDSVVETEKKKGRERQI